MPIKNHTRHEKPGKPPRDKPMFSKAEAGPYPHKALLNSAIRISSQVKPKTGVTKTLSR